MIQLVQPSPAQVQLASWMWGERLLLISNSHQKMCHPKEEEGKNVYLDLFLKLLFFSCKGLGNISVCAVHSLTHHLKDFYRLPPQVLRLADDQSVECI